MTSETGGDGVPRHPIGVVAERTGLSPALLRAWERRYAVVAPSRDETGQRIYSNADVARLRLLRLASEAGRSIGQVAQLPAAELAALVEEDAAFREEAAPEAVGAGAEVGFDFDEAESLYRAMDPEALEAQLRRSLAGLGLPSFVEHVAAPMLRRVGDRWHEGRLSPAQEHLATAALARVIVRGTDALVQAPGAPTLVVATPAGERHEIGALMAAAVAAAEGWRVVYLGADLPAGEIAEAARRVNARAVGLSVVFVGDRAHVTGEISRLRSALSAGTALLVGGAGAAALKPDFPRGQVELLGSFAELRAALRSRRLDARR